MPRRYGFVGYAYGVDKVTYYVVVALLVVATLACLGFATSQGLTALGLLGVAGALVSAAALFSYAGSMRRRQRPPMP